MPVDIPQLKEAIERIEWDCPGDVHVAGMSWDDRELVEAALRAVVEATTIQRCVTHGQDWVESQRACAWYHEDLGRVGSDCVIKPMLLVDPT